MSNVIHVNFRKPLPEKAADQLRPILQRSLEERGVRAPELAAALAGETVRLVQQWGDAHTFTLELDLTDQARAVEQLRNLYEELVRAASVAIGDAVVAGAHVAAAELKR